MKTKKESIHLEQEHPMTREKLVLKSWGRILPNVFGEQWGRSGWSSWWWKPGKAEDVVRDYKDLRRQCILKVMKNRIVKDKPGLYIHVYI
jgi:hypothetical protein